MKSLAGLPKLAGGAAAALAASPFSELQSTAHAATHNENQSFHFARHRWLCAVGRDPGLSGGDLRVAIMIWELTNADWGYAWPSLSYIAAQMSLDRSTVVRSVKKLVKRGWIIRRHGQFRSNQYYLTIGSKVMDRSD